MPSYKDPILIHFPHRLGGPPPHLETEDATIAEGFSPRATTHRRNAYWLNDAFACDDFRMYDYKVRRCMRSKSHDWTNCPFAHQGEKARRRDPRKIHYFGEPCPDFRKGSCGRGDACMYAHGVFECWLHPARYRTQPCKDGKDCKRKVCFFAHSVQQLRRVVASVEESVVESTTTMDLYSQVQELGSPVGMGSMEGFSGEAASRVDLYEQYEVGMGSMEGFSGEEASRVDLYEQYEVGMAQPTNSSALSSRDVCNNAHAGSVSETLSMSTWSSQTRNLSCSPYEPIFSSGFSLNHPMGVPLEAPPPSPGPASSGLGAICKNKTSLFEQSITPPICPSGSSSQQAAARRAVLMPEGYGKEGGSISNVSTGEVLDMVHCGGYGGTAHGYMRASRRRGADANEVENEMSGMPKLIWSTDQLALQLGKELPSYNSCGSYDLSSPTSTLAGPFYISSFSSPPLSPLNTPSSDRSNIFSSRADHGNAAQVDDRIPKADVHILSRQCMKKLDSKHISTEQGLDLPSTFFPRTSRQNKWIPQCNNWDAEGICKQGVMQKIGDRLGEESPAENAMPDIGWVCELVM